MPDSDPWDDVVLGAGATAMSGLASHWATGDAFVGMSITLGLILLAAWYSEVPDDA